MGKIGRLLAMMIGFGIDAAASAISGTVGAVTGALRAVRTTDALYTAFPRFVQVQCGSAYDHYQDRNDYKILHNYLPFRVYSALTFLLELTHR